MAISKVMVVDDAAPDRLNLQKILVDAGYQVIVAQSGREAIDKAALDRPDLIFMDIVMDEMDGFAACRKISDRDETSHIPVIMVSSKNQKVDRMWAERQGARAYVTKPYTSDEIHAEIQKLQ